MYAWKVDGQVLDFGVSGLLGNDIVLMYDSHSESLWCQVKRRAVAGPATGSTLRVLPSTVTTWEKWRRRHPKTLVPTTPTGHRRDYAKDPYEDYCRSKRGLFSVFRGGPGEEAKELVAGVEPDGTAKAYPVDRIRTSGPIRDRVGSPDLVVRLDPETDTLRVTTGDGKPVEALVRYWMVWKGVFPDALRYIGE